MNLKYIGILTDRLNGHKVIYKSRPCATHAEAQKRAEKASKRFGGGERYSVYTFVLAEEDEIWNELFLYYNDKGKIESVAPLFKGSYQMYPYRWTGDCYSRTTTTKKEIREGKVILK